MEIVQGINAGELVLAQHNVSEFVREQAAAAAARLGFGFRPSATAPETWSELKVEFDFCMRTKRDLRVPMYYTDDIFPTDEMTWTWRFWHDSMHVLHGYSFSAEDEMELAAVQLTMLRAAGYDHRSLEHRLLHADTMGQVLLYAESGLYPRSQLAFALRALEVGVPQAVTEEITAQTS